MKKIKLATVFSGIGAVEQALLRKKKDFEVVFAGDNGDIQLENVNFDKELEKIRKMKSINEKRHYNNSIYQENSRKTNFVKLSYEANYEINDNNFFYDIKMMDGKDFKNNVDILFGGSPCQSFSIAGQRGGLKDTRGTLFYDYVRILKEIRPRVFIYENVFGMLNHDKGNTWKVVRDVFDQIGYYYKWKVINAKDHGIPQSRRRIFIVGFKNKAEYNKFEFPQTRKLLFTMQDFLLDNVAEGNFKIDEYGNIKIIKGGQKIPEKCFLSEKLRKYVLSPGTKNFMHVNDTKVDLKIARALLSTQGNTHRASVNNYVISEGRIRALHPRETLRLMGFPDSYKIVVSKAQTLKQSGNSIVVDVIIDIITSVFEAIPEWGE